MTSVNPQVLQSVFLLCSISASCIFCCQMPLCQSPSWRPTCTSLNLGSLPVSLPFPASLPFTVSLPLCLYFLTNLLFPTSLLYQPYWPSLTSFLYLTAYYAYLSSYHPAYPCHPTFYLYQSAFPCQPAYLSLPPCHPFFIDVLPLASLSSHFHSLACSLLLPTLSLPGCLIPPPFYLIYKTSTLTCQIYT